MAAESAARRDARLPVREHSRRFDTTIAGSNNDYFPRSGSALSTTAGSARISQDFAAGAKCGPFVSFGTWSTTLP
jgi:hypothetical protein